MMNYDEKYNEQFQRYERLRMGITSLTAQLDKHVETLESYKNEYELIDKSLTALKDAMPILSATSIRACEELANNAIQTVFGLDYTVEWDSDGGRFILNKGDYCTDLADSEGGGMLTLVSFVFNIFLINKLGCRRFMAFDEAFTQVSASYFPSFVTFIREMCHSLNVDLLLISHDQRITGDDVDHLYKMEDGHCVKLK